MHAAAAAAAADAGSNVMLSDAGIAADAVASAALAGSLASSFAGALASVAGAGSLHVLSPDVLLHDNVSTPMELNVDMLLNDELTSHANGETKSSNATDFMSSMPVEQFGEIGKFGNSEFAWRVSTSSCLISRLVGDLPRHAVIPSDSLISRLCILKKLSNENVLPLNK